MDFFNAIKLDHQYSCYENQTLELYLHNNGYYYNLLKEKMI